MKMLLLVLKKRVFEKNVIGQIASEKSQGDSVIGKKWHTKKTMFETNGIGKIASMKTKFHGLVRPGSP